MACRRQSPRTGGPSSLLLCGSQPARAWASSTHSRQLTIHKATAWLSVCTGSSRMPYVHVVRVPRGTPIFHGCCWAYVPHLRRILRYLQRSWSLGHPTGSSWTAPARASSSTCRRAAATYEAAVLCGGGQHSAGSLSQGGVRVRAGWRPADLCHPGGPAAGDRVSG